MKKNTLLVIVFILLFSNLGKAQTQSLWGLSGDFGKGSGGYIFSVPTAGPGGSIYERGDFLTTNYSGNTPLGSLIKGRDGLLYGLTSAGGKYSQGTIFSYNRLLDTITDLYSFGTNGGTKDANGPGADLLQVNDSMFYGLTGNGGNNYEGTLFSFNIKSGVETVLHSFGGGTESYNPASSVMLASNGWLYGTTRYRGTKYSGAIFGYNLANDSFAVVYNFKGNGTDGDDPQGALIQTNDSLLYGTTHNGGIHGTGTLFSFNINTGVETSLYSFGANLKASTPTGTLVQGNDSLLFGMSNEGGYANYGTIFKYNILRDTVTLSYQFSNGTDGGYPRSSLIKSPDSDSTILYGGNSSGTNSSGVIFSFNMATAAYNVMATFTHGFYNGTLIGHLLLLTDTSIATLTTHNNNVAGIKLFPNPATGNITLTLPDNTGSFIWVDNLLGERVFELTTPSLTTTINLSKQPNGIYFVHVETGDTIKTEKIIISR